jgi:hypothetical protein
MRETTRRKREGTMGKRKGKAGRQELLERRGRHDLRAGIKNEVRNWKRYETHKPSIRKTSGIQFEKR